MGDADGAGAADSAMPPEEASTAGVAPEAAPGAPEDAHADRAMSEAPSRILVEQFIEIRA